MSFEDKIRKASLDEKDSAFEVIDMIKSAHRVSKIIEWPGVPSVKIRMRLLNASEAREAKVSNQQEFKRDGIEVGVQNLADYREQEAIHGLWRVFSDADSGKPIFESAEDMRRICTNDEVAALCSIYNAFADENDPNLERLSDEDLERLKELLKKKPDLIPSKVLSLNTAWKLLRITAAQL